MQQRRTMQAEAELEAARKSINMIQKRLKVNLMDAEDREQELKDHISMLEERVSEAMAQLKTQSEEHLKVTLIIHKTVISKETGATGMFIIYMSI